MGQTRSECLIELSQPECVECHNGTLLVRNPQNENWICPVCQHTENKHYCSMKSIMKKLLELEDRIEELEN
jgi:hypothetical protein